MKYPKQIQTWKGRIAYKLEWHWYAFERGKNDIIGRFTGLFTELGVIYLVLDKLGVKLSASKLGILLFIGFCFVYVIGRIYTYIGWDKVRLIVSNERNPQMMEMYKGICEDDKKKICYNCGKVDSYSKFIDVYGKRLCYNCAMKDDEPRKVTKAY
jgi:hypothetical protein